MNYFIRNYYFDELLEVFFTATTSDSSLEPTDFHFSIYNELFQQ